MKRTVTLTGGLVMAAALSGCALVDRWTLRRLKEDRCLEPRDQGVEMRWTFQEMGLAPGTRVSIENPYQLSRAAG